MDYREIWEKLKRGEEHIFSDSTLDEFIDFINNDEIIVSTDDALVSRFATKRNPHQFGTKDVYIGYLK